MIERDEHTESKEPVDILYCGKPIVTLNSLDKLEQLVEANKRKDRLKKMKAEEEAHIKDKRNKQIVMTSELIK